MSNNKGLVYVKLRDRGIIFHDASQEQSITGTAVVGFKRTPKVSSAIKTGLLVEVKDYQPKAESKIDTKPVEDKNYSKWNKAKLQEELTAREVDFDPEATNAELVVLLETYDEDNKK